MKTSWNSIYVVRSTKEKQNLSVYKLVIIRVVKLGIVEMCLNHIAVYLCVCVDKNLEGGKAKRKTKLLIIFHFTTAINSKCHFCSQAIARISLAFQNPKIILSVPIMVLLFSVSFYCYCIRIECWIDLSKGDNDLWVCP